MAITFTYDESDNKVVNTEGTSGTPSTCATFVTADRAGTAELTPEDAPVACTTNITLTYQIRPVEDLALQITFTLAGTSAGAGDTLDVTGTDWRDAAQSESIDVSGGDAAYTGTKYWRTITDIDCTGWADGTLKVTQPIWGVIWDYGNGQYRIDATRFIIGNGGTSTYFSSKNEDVYFTGVVFTDAATLTLGAASGSYSKDGSRWTINGSSTSILTYGSSTFYCYGSIIYRSGNTDLKFDGGDITIIDSILCRDDTSNPIIFETGLSSLVMNNVYIANVQRISVRISATLNDIHIEGCNQGFLGYGADAVVSNLNVTNVATNDVYTYNVNTTLIDPKFHVATPQIVGATKWIKEAYTCNIHVADKDGGAIANTATVLCTRANVVTESAKFYKCISAHTSGTFATDLAAGKWEEITDATILAAAPAWLTSTAYVSAEQEFSVNPTSGAIAEQTLTYKKWTGTSELETKYIHTFTLSKAGYETLVLDNITVDGAIDWHLELQPIGHPPGIWR